MNPERATVNEHLQHGKQIIYPSEIDTKTKLGLWRRANGRLAVKL